MHRSTAGNLIWDLVITKSSWYQSFRTKVLVLIFSRCRIGVNWWGETKGKCDLVTLTLCANEWKYTKNMKPMSKMEDSSTYSEKLSECPPWSELSRVGEAQPQTLCISEVRNLILHQRLLQMLIKVPSQLELDATGGSIACSRAWICCKLTWHGCFFVVNAGTLERVPNHYLW